MHRILIVGSMFSGLMLVGARELPFAAVAEVCMSYLLVAGLFWPVFFMVGALIGPAGRLTFVAATLAMLGFLITVGMARVG